MSYVIVLLLGCACGAICTFIAVDHRRRELALRETKLARSEERIAEQAAEVAARREEAQARMRDLERRATQLADEEEEFRSRVVSYEELKQENIILKRDLQNVDVNLRKLQLDRDVDRERHAHQEERTGELCRRYMKESIKWISASLTPNNFAASKQRLLNVINWCRDAGFEVPATEEESLLEGLKEQYEKVVRAAFEREEQARIRAQIREEQLREREIERELKRLERERAAIQAALDQALARARDEHSAEVEHLKARLAEAEERTRRTISQAQLTRAGHIYVISNIGSFGEGVFKIGMTRRLEPMDRVRELGDASVPFPFDVHMMISCDDAPTLENALHRVLHKTRLNKANPRKEFFRTTIEEVAQIVREHHGDIQYVADPEALEYRQSLAMSEEDQEFVEHVYDELDDDGAVAAED